MSYANRYLSYMMGILCQFLWITYLLFAHVSARERLNVYISFHFGVCTYEMYHMRIALWTLGRGIFVCLCRSYSFGLHVGQCDEYCLCKFQFSFAFSTLKPVICLLISELHLDILLFGFLIWVALARTSVVGIITSHASLVLFLHVMISRSVTYTLIFRPCEDRLLFLAYRAVERGYECKWGAEILSGIFCLEYGEAIVNGKSSNVFLLDCFIVH